jgi:hypothetical protein
VFRVVIPARHASSRLPGKPLADIAGQCLHVGDQFTIKSTQGTDDKLYTLRVIGVSDGRQYFFQPAVVVPFATWNKIRPQPAIPSDSDPTEAELISNVIEESLRFDSPVQLLARTCTEKIDVDGVSVAKGDRILYSIASANREASALVRW